MSTAEQLPVYGCDEDGVVVHPHRLLPICDEGGDTLWLPKAWLTRGQAKAAAANGHYDVTLDCLFTEVRVTTEWLRCEDRYEDGHRLDAWMDAGGMYYPAEPGAEHAEPYWRCEYVPRRRQQGGRP